MSSASEALAKKERKKRRKKRKWALRQQPYLHIDIPGNAALLQIPAFTIVGDPTQDDRIKHLEPGFHLFNHNTGEHRVYQALDQVFYDWHDPIIEPYQYWCLFRTIMNETHGRQFVAYDELAHHIVNTMDYFIEELNKCALNHPEIEKAINEAVTLEKLDHEISFDHELVLQFNKMLMTPLYEEKNK